MFVCGDVVYAQTWQVLTMENCMEPFSYASTAYLVASALVSVRLFCKNLGNLQKFFEQMVYRPPGQKIARTPMVVNEDKSVWEPTQLLDWLGITRNSALGTLKIVERRIVKIINGTIDHIIEADFKVSARELASFTGQIFYRACSW